jgi:hypothetical protein
MVSHFADAVRGRCEMRFGLEDSLAQAVVIDGLFASARGTGAQA